jgi:malonyl-CoA O-methyltransferase
MMINDTTSQQSLSAPLPCATDQRTDIHGHALQCFYRRLNQRYASKTPFIWHEVQTRLQERLDLLTVQPKRILNAMARDTTAHDALSKRYPKAAVYPVVRSQSVFWNAAQSAWCRWRNSTDTPISYDLIVCNLALTWALNPVEQLREWASQLAPGGVLLFSALGPDTGRNLRLAAQQAGWVTPIAPDFVDMHDYGDMMVQAGLSTPVLDIERLSLSYSNIQRLKEDNVGLMANLHPKRLAGLAGKARFERLKAILNAQTPLILEFELVFGHAWKPLTLSVTPQEGTLTKVSLDSLKGTLPSRKNK